MFTVADPMACVAWYAAHFDGTPTSFRHHHAVVFENGTVMVFDRGPANSMAKTTLDRLGLLAANPDALAKALGGTPASEDSPALVTDPNGVRVALYRSADATGLVEVSVRAAEPSSILGQLSGILGGAPETLPVDPARRGIHYGPAWLSVAEYVREDGAESGEPVIVGWESPDIEAVVARIRSQETPLALGPARFPEYTIVRLKAGDALIAEVFGSR